MNLIALLLLSSLAAHPIAWLASFAVLFGMATTAFPLVPSGSPDQDTLLGEAANLPFQFQVAAGATDAITGGGGVLGVPPGVGGSVPICGTVFVTTAGVDAMTLATPVAGPPSGGKNQNDGLSITIMSTTAQAHTVTCANNKINGNKHIATFAGAVGNFVTFVAYQGIWYMEAQAGITLS